MSVYIEAMRPLYGRTEDARIMQGSGFVLEHRGGNFLVTNGHIVTGRDRKTDVPFSTAALPKKLRIEIPVVGPEEGRAILATRTATIDLYDDDGLARWLVHPILGRRLDVVAVPILDATDKFPDLNGVYLPYRLSPDELVEDLEPPDEVSIIGFPYGLRGGASTAIWIRGTVASEPAYMYEGEKCFLVDARTREGQSGSPVIRMPSSDPDSDPEWDLLGVYSSRVSEISHPAQSSDLGRVWTASAIRSVVEGETLDTLTYE
jgi:hypothetical protein